MALGSVVGFMAGLLGIGGGLIVVPALFYLLPKLGVNADYVPLIAIATSLANMVLTTFSSVAAHHRRQNLDWNVAKVLVPGIFIGAMLSGSVASYIPAEAMKQFFAVFVILMAINMAKPIKAEANVRSLPSVPVLFVLMVVIAILCGLLGIGGGVIIVPLLCYFGQKMQRAVGLSSMAGFCVALAGSIGYIIAGWNVPDLPSGTMGYIYTPALIGIALTSTLVAPLGVKAAMTWPTPTLKKVFAVFLFFVGIELVISSFSG
ncbi:sulfite exporter TauE/SafE family protein [Parashewanella curva]|uniref:Probable membrane transporter protein n=2 Tax=Parashewanella curva TaxID=2338552 RepID=A0A3L8Q3J3_9GAMM|nr:sulfite exporter TauE/SafE family protein [Parashewanella curva]RLV61703.1 sulfite exporter TauE/SafE family protein [Parashewanella curva]